MPNEVDPRFERYRVSEGRDIYGETLKPYDPSREERRTEQDTSLYKDYGFAMTESQKELEDQYKKSITSVTDVYTPVTDFEKAYSEWYQSGIQPESFAQSSASGSSDLSGLSGYAGESPSSILKVGETTYYFSPSYGAYQAAEGSFVLPKFETRVVPTYDPETGTTNSNVETLVGTSEYTTDEYGNQILRQEWVPGDLNYVSSPTTGIYIPKELTDPTSIAQYLSNPTDWETAFKEEWYKTSPSSYSEANISFYEAITEADRQKTEVYNQLGIRTNNRLYLDESNNYDKTVMSMQQRFESRIASKQAMLNQIMQVK